LIVSGFSQPLDLLILLLVAFLALGPKRFPETARKLGHGLREARQSLTSLTVDGSGEGTGPSSLNTDDEPYAVSPQATPQVSEALDASEGKTPRPSARELDTIG
jgi:Sec-independent protein translocase protein TatA